MKLSTLILFCSSMLLFSSCGEDSSESIIGTYILESVSPLPGCDEPELDNIIVQDGCIVVDDESSCITFTISENGVAQVINTDNGDSETINLTYTFNEDTDVITLCAGSDCNDLTISGEKLSFSDFEDGCDIVYVFKKE